MATNKLVNRLRIYLILILCSTALTTLITTVSLLQVTSNEYMLDKKSHFISIMNDLMIYDVLMVSNLLLFSVACNIQLKLDGARLGILILISNNTGSA